MFHCKKIITIFFGLLCALSFNISLAMTPVSTRAAGETGLSHTSSKQSTTVPHSRVSRYSDEDIWVLMARDFKLKDYRHQPEVKAQINYFLKHKRLLYHYAEQSKPYLYYIYHESQKRHLPAELTLLPMIESAYDPFAYSGVGAAGLWQFMPGTASGFGIKQDWWYDGRKDIISSTGAAFNYLSYLNRFFDNNWLYAIGAYNSGEGTVQNAINYNTKYNRSTSFWHLPIPEQTRIYVPRLLALATIIKYQQHYGVHLPKVPNKPYFKKVSVDHQMDLSKAAKLAGISTTQLYKLNPGYIRWATDPDGPYQLLIPVSHVSVFKKNLKELDEGKKLVWKRYKVKPGDSLSMIAEKYHTSTTAIEKANKLKKSMIHPQQILLIPANQHTVTDSMLKGVDHYPSKGKAKLPGPRKVLYTVKPGDSIWKLSRQYSVTEIELRFWNKLKRNEPLQVGQHLIIWEPAHHYANGKRKKSNIEYTVKLGDSLSAIADHYRVSTEDVAKWNGLKLSSMLHPGQTLVIH